MSAFLSQIHTNLYNKIKYEESLADILAALLHQKNEHILTFEDMKLPQGQLEDIIDLGQIHYWLLVKIQMVEERFSKLLEAIKEEGLLTQSKDAFYQVGESLAKTHSLHDAMQAFQTIQTYMLDGMPCDKGIQLLEKTEASLTFSVTPDVHIQIDDLPNFLNLRTSWIRGLLSNSNLSLHQSDNTFHITKEDFTCNPSSNN